MIAAGVKVLDRQISGMGRELPNLELEVLVCVVIQEVLREAIETQEVSWNPENPLGLGLISPHR